jgi:hypothetical protein
MSLTVRDCRLCTIYDALPFVLLLAADTTEALVLQNLCNVLKYSDIHYIERRVERSSMKC